MQMTSMIRAAGITLVCVGAGMLLHTYISAREVLRATGRDPDAFIGFAFLGKPLTWVDLNLHDTYYVVADLRWNWLFVLGCLAGAVMAARPDWLSLSKRAGERG